MNKIYIYEAEVLKKRENFENTIVNYVKLTRPEGLEEHMPNVGDIVNLYFPCGIIYITHKIIGKQKDNIYIIELEPVEIIKYDVKIENLKDEGLEYLLDLSRYINNEIGGLSKLTKTDIDLNKCLRLYFDISKDMISSENFYECIKEHVKQEIKDNIRGIDVWVDTYHYADIEVYTNKPTIAEVIDKDYDTSDGTIKFKGIIEKEIQSYRICIKTNIYKK